MCLKSEVCVCTDAISGALFVAEAAMDGQAIHSTDEVMPVRKKKLLVVCSIVTVY